MSKAKIALALVSFFAVTLFAITPPEIMSNNSGALVFLEVRSEKGVRDSGTGFIVSHDGYLITAGHIKPDPTESMVGFVGQRSGTSFPLTFIDSDKFSDIALWRFPQSIACRQAITFGSAPLKVFDRLLVLGFPGTSGLTPTGSGISNLYGERGFVQTDGNLESGNSGGPALDELGFVRAIVQGGRAVGARDNSMVPITPVLALMDKHGVKYGVDKPVPFLDECYALCRTATHGVERWQKEEPWSRNSGQMPGGHNRLDECNKLKAATISNQSDVELDITSMSEDSHKDIGGHVEYEYHCSGVLKSQPIYKQTRSPACGLLF